MHKLKALGAALLAACLMLLPGTSSGQAVPFQAKTKYEAYLRSVQIAKGFVNVMFAGDSMMAGNGSDMGLRLPIALSLKAHGIDPTFVGEITDNAATARWFYNTFGNVTKHQSVGGITSNTLLNGGSGLSSFSAALIAQQPDVLFVAIGTNDTSPNHTQVYKDLLDVCYAYKPDMPVVWYTPMDSNAVTVSYYNADTSRASTRADIRAACSTRLPANVMFVDGSQALGMHTWYPGTDLTANNNNANGLFADSTHLRNGGWAIYAAAGTAQLFGCSVQDELQLLCSFEPYLPIDFPDNGQDIAAAGSAVLIAGGPYKRCMTDLTVYNSDASATATVTVYKRRVSQDGSTTATDTAWRTFKVPAGATVGWSWTMSGNNSTTCTGPVAFYNEGWKVAVAGATCNVRMGGKSTVW